MVLTVRKANYKDFSHKNRQGPPILSWDQALHIPGKARVFFKPLQMCIKACLEHFSHHIKSSRILWTHFMTQIYQILVFLRTCLARLYDK